MKEKIEKYLNDEISVEDLLKSKMERFKEIFMGMVVENIIDVVKEELQKKGIEFQGFLITQTNSLLFSIKKGSKDFDLNLDRQSHTIVQVTISKEQDSLFDTILGSISETFDVSLSGGQRENLRLLRVVLGELLNKIDEVE